MWILYELLLALGLLFYLPKALWRRRLPHRGWRMRLGRYPAEVHRRLRERRVIWVNAVSVGEVLAALPLLQALARAAPQHGLVLSTTTPGGFDVASKRIGEGAIPIYFPLDFRGCVRRALDVLRPQLLVLVESELWPTVIRLTRARGVPVVVVNGRISRRASQGYRLVRPWITNVLNCIDAFLMQSQADAQRLISAGAPPERVQVVGSLKWDASLMARPTPQAIRECGQRIGLNGRELVIVAGSTHRGEETAMLQAFQALRRAHSNARLILAPRHLERVPEVEDLIRRTGLTPTRLSNLTSGGAWEVGVVDTFGGLPHYYGLATAVFIGGSLIPHGGQNPLEAASLGKPVIFGPFMHNFDEMAGQLLSHRAARQLADTAELTPILQQVLSQPAEAQAMGRRAQELAERSQGATTRTLQALSPFLTRPSSTT